MTKQSTHDKKVCKKAKEKMMQKEKESDTNKHEDFDKQEKWLFKHFDINAETFETSIYPKQNDMFHRYVQLYIEKRRKRLEQQI